MANRKSKQADGAVRGDISTTTHGLAGDDEHQIEGAFYWNNGITFKPLLQCSCGFATKGADTWEEAGADMDSHLEDVEE